jgi:hypothetical protein
LLLGLLIYPLTLTWGMVGAAWAIVAASVLGGVAGVYMAIKILRIPAHSVIQALGYPIVSALFMLSALFTAQWAAHWSVGIGQLASLVGLGVFTYGIGVMACRKMFGYSAGGILTGTLSVKI